MKFLEKLLKKKIDHIGLDIGHYGIKLVELKRGDAKDNHQVINYGQITLPDKAIIDGAIRNERAVTDALQKLKDYRDIKDSATVNVSVTGRHVITRTLKLPVMPLDELNQAVIFEAEKYITTPLEQLYIDYTILGEVTTDDAMQYNILLAAVPRPMIDTICRVVKAAGLRIYGVEIEPLALYRIWNSYYSDEALANQAILNIGHTSSNLVVFQNDNIQFTRNIPIAGLQLTESIINTTQQEAAAAVELKHKHHLRLVASDGDINELDNDDAEETGTATDSQYQMVDNALGDTLSSLTEEIRRSIDFYQMQAKVRLDRLIITGGSATIQGIDNLLESELGIPVLIGTYADLEPIYSVACGLAMKDFMNI